MTVLVKIKRLLSSSEGRLKIFIGVTGLSLLLMILSVGALELTSTPAFCKSCHEMNPEYFTWQASAHNQIACVKCHIRPGTTNFVKHKAASISQLYFHFTDTYVTPIEIKEKIDNEVCQQCHDMDKRVTTPSGDIKFPHSKHLVEKVKCVECHAGVVHGSIEEKGFTALTDYDTWNAAVGKQYINSSVSSEFTKLPMKDCIICHTEKDAPVKCDTCHSKLIKPKSHLAGSWMPNHGLEASKDFKACDTCHSVTSKYHGTLPNDETLADYARTNSLCNECHAKKPIGHTAAWKRDHGLSAKENRELCLVCHSQSQRKSNASTSLSCDICHYMKHLSLSTHKVPIPASGYGPQCSRCHPQGSCETCHISTNTTNSQPPKEDNDD